MRSSFRRKLCVLLFSAFAGMARDPTRTLADDFPAKPAPEWDALFHRKDGWTGGDAMYSVDLADGRALWLFADTWIGPVRDNKHSPGSTIVNNSIAIHPIRPGGAAPDKVTFFWGPDNAVGKPTAWVRPERSDQWYWVADGIVMKSESGSDVLVVFLWRIERAGVEGVFNFQSAGGAVATVENPHDEVPNWRVATMDNPHAAIPTRNSSPDRDAAVGWGVELLHYKDDMADSVLIYGARKSGWANEILVARAPANSITTFAEWQFYSGGKWSSDVAQATPVADGVTTEFSMTEVVHDGQRRYVLISSEILFGGRIFARISDSPFGPWSNPTPIFQVPELERNTKYFTYAAKAHPELSAPGELLLTYVVNSFDFAAMVNDADIYRPRFLRLPLEAILKR